MGDFNKKHQKGVFHAKGITKAASCLYLLGRKPNLTTTCHPGYPVRENKDIPTK